MPTSSDRFERLRIHRTRPETAPPLQPDADPAEPGAVRIGTDRHPYVRAGRDWLKLLEVQWEGKPRVSGPDFVNGMQPAERDGLRFT
jgi:methionyl-tRNA formyltransferase